LIQALETSRSIVQIVQKRRGRNSRVTPNSQQQAHHATGHGVIIGSTGSTMRRALFAMPALKHCSFAGLQKGTYE